MAAFYKNEKKGLKTFWYNGTDTLKEGYAMCLDRDNITGLDGSGVAEPATDFGWARQGWVGKPARGNRHPFGGTVGDAGVDAGDHVRRVHSFGMAAGSNRSRVGGRANQNFAARKGPDVERARADRTVTIDAQRGVEIPVA